MSDTYRDTWENYVAAWKTDDTQQRQALFARSLDPRCEYRDPITHASGWDALAGYMRDFHQQVPGGHFVTTWFLAHHDRSIAKWEMRAGDGTHLGDGVSYGEYDQAGRLLAMSGFFETP